MFIFNPTVEGGAVIKAFHLNLRVKIMFILGCYILGIMSMDFVSYDDLHTTEEKIEILELAYSLNNIILEARRYEKNFLLYNEGRRPSRKIKGILLRPYYPEEILSKGEKLKVAPILKELDDQIVAYGASIGATFSAGSPMNGEHSRIVDRLRDKGKQMTELTEKIVDFERTRSR